MFRQALFCNLLHAYVGTILKASSHENILNQPIPGLQGQAHHSLSVDMTFSVT